MEDNFHNIDIPFSKENSKSLISIKLIILIWWLKKCKELEKRRKLRTLENVQDKYVLDTCTYWVLQRDAYTASYLKILHSVVSEEAHQLRVRKEENIYKSTKIKNDTYILVYEIKGFFQYAFPCAIHIRQLLRKLWTNLFRHRGKRSIM